MTASISMRNIAKSYKGNGRMVVPVLQDVSLEIPSGTFVALMGPSGTGKTTILNLMGGLDKPDSGEIVVGERHLECLSGDDLGAWRFRNVGFVFQAYRLIPVLSAAGNVELPLLLTKLSRSERRLRVQAALECVGISDRASHYPSQLSGGQQQRVGIARALVTEPALLLCDEPTGDLDRKSADEILTLLQRLNHTKGRTVVMVTHDVTAAHYATTILHFERGEITRLEAPRQS